MKSTTRLDSTVFQLTPTRTRCDLYIVANGKKEKLASGLLQPFLPHLKTAEEQIAKGGYSISLQPPADDDAMWFTKGVVERFVRFVSTPEILERVYTIESEIVQIEKAIAIQGKNNIGINEVGDHHMRSVPGIEGSKSNPDATEEKAIVLYTPDPQSAETNESVSQEGNSKVQLLKVLETRKKVLQKEQGMAFARAAAAGLDMDHMPQLVSFAKCFGASRLMDACLRFMDLWKGKHESGQWFEIEAAEAVARKSEFSTMHASGIMLSSTANNNELQRDLSSEIDEKAGANTSAGVMPSMNHRVPSGQQEYFQGQLPYPVFPPWPMHSPSSGTPFYPGFPMQGTPYYPNYLGNGAYQQSLHQVAEDSQLSTKQRERQKRQSMDSTANNSESESSEIDASGGKETTHGEPRKQAGRSGKKQPGVVVIRNVNYITSKQKKSSGSESSSDSGSNNDDNRNMLADTADTRHKDWLRASKRKQSDSSSTDPKKSYDKEAAAIADGGHWQAFQSCLLRDVDEENIAANGAMFASEKDVKMKRPQNTVGDDLLAFTKRSPVELQGRRSSEFDKASRHVSRLTRALDDELSTDRVGSPNRNSRFTTDDTQFSDVNGRNIVYSTENDDFMVGGEENKSKLRSLSDLAINRYEVSTDNSAYMADESFIVPFRSMSLDQVGTDGRANLDMDPEFPSKHDNSENIINKDCNRLNYESAELSLLPERGSEKRSISYDPALDYETHFEDAASKAKKHKEAVIDATQKSKNVEKDRRSKVISATLDNKKIGGPLRKGKQSKMSHLDEARLRAEKLRTYKADLQKLRKEKEEAEHKRIEALKRERQKRIAARGSFTSAQSSLPSMSTRKSLPTKLSPISHRGSKFSDLEPGSPSPLQRSKIRTASLGSTDSKIASKISKSIDVNHLTGNRLTRSVSSLTESKNESYSGTADSKASLARIRKLSEPKTISSHSASSMKSRSAESTSKLKMTDGSEGKEKYAIANLDHTKAATLPELKTKTSKGTINVKQKKSMAKDTTLKVNGGKASLFSKNADNLEDNPVIEKTVVILECQTSSIPALEASEYNMGVTGKHNETSDSRNKTSVVSEYAPIRATLSPMDKIDQEANPVQSQDNPSCNKMMTNFVEKEFTNLSSIDTSEDPYQAPVARVSSLEDPCTRNSEYGKAQARCLQSATPETTNIHVSHLENMKFELNPEAVKPQIKESSKGFIRFLKLGRKNHTSAVGEQNSESHNISFDGLGQDDSAKNAAPSVEVHTLKNLISQDETPTVSSTSQKSSRHFSLLYHFRSKTSEKISIS